MRLHSTAISTPAPQAVSAAEAWAAACSPSLIIRINPVRSSASTSTKSPATSGSTAQDTDFTVSQGEVRSTSSTIATVTRPQTAVGRPSWRSNAEEISRATAVSRMPAPASLPAPVRAGTSTSASIASDARALAWVRRSTA